MSDLGCVSRSLEALVAELVAPPDYNPTVASHAPRSRTKNQTGQPRRRNAKRKAGGRRAGVAPFIKKIFQITNDPRYTSIYWTPKGNSFVINKDTFEVRFQLQHFTFKVLGRVPAIGQGPEEADSDQ